MPREKPKGVRDRGITAVLDDRVNLTQQQADQFANDLRRYMRDERDVRIESVEFRWWDGAEIFKAFVKTEKRKSGAAADVYESIGGPEVHLLVNAAQCAGWMLGCDPFSAEVLQKYFLEIAQVVEYTLTGTWQFHNVTLCCTRWGDTRGSTIECCAG